MQESGVRDLVKRILEKHRDDERMLDGYWQWASNPTPPSGGYALEENCGFISTNLMNRYGEPAVDLVSRLSDECREMRREASVYDLRQAIYTVLGGDVGEALREGIVRRLRSPAPVRRFLAAWSVSRTRWNFAPGRDGWVAGEFDWTLGTDLENGAADVQTEVALVLFGEEIRSSDLAREGLAVGLINRLFFRDSTGRMEPRMRPGPRISASRIAY